MAKTEKKTRESKPFVQRLNNRMKALGILANKLHNHGGRDNDKMALALAKAMNAVVADATTFLKGKSADFKLAGSPTSSAARSWAVGDEAVVVEDYLMLFPWSKKGQTHKVVDIKRIGGNEAGKGSKVFLIFDGNKNGLASMFE